MKKRIANLTSNILNPFLVSFAIVVLLSFQATATLSDALKWTLLLVGISILPVFLVILYLVHSDRVDGIFINIRTERHKIYLLSCLCLVAGGLLLSYLKAPITLIATVVAGLLSIVVFMSINFLWKISIHTAFIAASVTILTIIYGMAGAFSVALLPPTAWARTELERHSLAQTIAGALLSPLIVAAVFYLFGLIPFKAVA